MRIPFGKYKDVELEKVPRYYLRWLRRQDWVGQWLVQAIDQVLAGKEVGRPMTMDETVFEPFSVRQTGYVGQEILDQDGCIIAWTTNSWLAKVICRLLTENQELLKRQEEICQ